MATRSKPCWVYLDGGPADGTRAILFPPQQSGRFIHEMMTPDVNTVLPLEYELTPEMRRGSPHESTGRVAKFIEAQPPRPRVSRSSQVGLFNNHRDYGSGPRP